ncbi:hypothetical protein BGZ94_004395 [Podila epigama]|nr:hypothetical protein BGZ94_004395 [Podila epigama]
MARIALFFLIATMALLSSTHAQQSSNKAQCDPIHKLYKERVAPCTQNNNAIPHTDADPRWRDCICKPGFFWLATASEECMLDGTKVAPQITADGLNKLCAGFVGYVEATKQERDPALAPALASATSIKQSMPQPTADAGSGSGSGSGSGTTSAATSLSHQSATYVMAFAAVLVATVASF